MEEREYPEYPVYREERNFGRAMEKAKNLFIAGVVILASLVLILFLIAAGLWCVKTIGALIVAIFTMLGVGGYGGMLKG